MRVDCGDVESSKVKVKVLTAMSTTSNFQELFTNKNKSSFGEHNKNCSARKNKDFNVVCFDLETTGLESDAFILQISAKYEDHTFNAYVRSNKNIHPKASEINGLYQYDGELYLRDEALQTFKISRALQLFRNFLNEYSPEKKVLLVAHNATFDESRLTRAIVNNDMILDFKMIAGFSDTYALLKKKYPDRKGQDQLKLQTLAIDFLQMQNSSEFHNSVYDVKVLQNLVSKLDLKHELLNEYKTFDQCCQEFLQKNNKKKLALQKINFDLPLSEYNSKGEPEINGLFTRLPKDNKVKIKTTRSNKKDRRDWNIPGQQKICKYFKVKY